MNIVKGIDPLTAKKYEQNLLITEGIIKATMGDLKSARMCFNAGLIIAEEANDKLSVVKIRNNISNTYLMNAEYDKALENYQECLVILQELGDKRNIGVCLGNIGLVYTHKGELNKALNYYEKSLAIAEELGDILKIPVRKNLLIRIKNTKPQAQFKDAQKRKKNIKNAFQISKSKNLPEKVIIVDDVGTTFGTITECAKQLHKAGVKEIKGLVFAKG